MDTLLIVLFGGFTFFMLQLIRGMSFRALRCPPGPRGWPIIGNLLDIPTSYPWVTYSECANTYGPVMHLRVLGRPIMVLNSAKASFDLLEARSANYSDRGQSIITSLFGLEWNTAFIPYGPKWRRHRRAIHQYFNSSAIQEYQPVQLCKTREMLVQALQSPSKILDLIEFAVGSSLIDIAYGHRAQDAQDAYIARAHTAAARTSYVLVSGRFFVEFLPFLRHVPAWLPGAAFKRLANDVVAEQKALVDIPFHDVRAEIDSGCPNTSICARMLDSLDRSESADRDAELEVIKNTTGIIFAGIS